MAGGLQVCSIVGARPQFIKLAPICRAIDRWNENRRDYRIAHTIVHTGQHYDVDMSDAQWTVLELPTADINLGVGSGNHGAQSGKMLISIEEIILRDHYDAVLIYGDTNSTLAGSLAAAKLRVPAIHIEAGLRSYDRRMPEEINRIVADHISDLLLAPTHAALETLEQESLADCSVWVGDVMLDAVEYYRGRAPTIAELPAEIRPEREPFALVTIHRAENTEPDVLRDVLAALDAVAAELPVVFPVHPRTAGVIEREFATWPDETDVALMRPVNYLEMIALGDAASVIVTDSGGLQKEAMFLGTPCVTLRDRTEWTETLAVGANRLVGGRPDDVVAGVTAALQDSDAGRWVDEILPEYGGGQAANRIVDELTGYLAERAPK